MEKISFQKESQEILSLSLSRHPETTTISIKPSPRTLLSSGRERREEEMRETRTQRLSLTWRRDAVGVEMRMMMGAAEDPLALEVVGRRAGRAGRRQMGRRIVESGRRQGGSAEVACRGDRRGRMGQFPLARQRGRRFRRGGRTARAAGRRRRAPLRGRAAQYRGVSGRGGEQGGDAEVGGARGGGRGQVAGAGYVAVGVGRRRGGDRGGCEGRVLVESRR